MNDNNEILDYSIQVHLVASNDNQRLTPFERAVQWMVAKFCRKPTVEQIEANSAAYIARLISADALRAFNWRARA